MSLLAPNLLPTADNITESADIPSAGELRPFGLTHAHPVPPGASTDLTGLVYDPNRQINLTLAGAPAIGDINTPQMVTKIDTQYDHTWVVDKD